jgi:uncharacterized coiled-coil protein SlyX
MTLVNVVDARPNAPITTFELETLITQPDPRDARITEVEAKLAEVQTQLKELQKLAAVTDKIHQLEAQLKALQAMVVALYDKLNSTPQSPQPTHPTNGHREPAITAEPPPAKAVEQNPTPPPTDVREMLKRLMPTEEEIERMVLRVLYKRLDYWHGRANLKVDERGYVVIGRDTNFGVKFSRFAAIMAKYGLSDYVFPRGNDNAGYYVEIKASDMETVLRHLKSLDEALKGAITRIR